MKVKNVNKNQALKLLSTVTLTDGYLQINNKNCRWELETSPNPALHKICNSLFLKAFNIETNFRFTKNKRFMRTDISGQKYRYHLTKIDNLTKSDFKFLKKESKEFKILAFRLAMDLEGSISTKFSIKKKTYKNHVYFQFQFDPELKLSSIEKSKLDDWTEILNNIGLSFTNHLDKRYDSGIQGIRTSNRNQIIKFDQIGGFLTDVKITKSSVKNNVTNNNFSKRNILKTIISIFENHPKLCSRSFGNKDEAEQYKKWFIQRIFLPARNKYK